MLYDTMPLKFVVIKVKYLNDDVKVKATIIKVTTIKALRTFYHLKQGNLSKVHLNQ
jgi:hypothetical protein